MIGPTAEETEQFIIQAHGQQTRRRSDVLYHTHPIAVSKMALEILVSENPNVSDRDAEFVVKLALLHDVVEDTEVDFMMLAKMGYPITLLNSLYLLTKFDDEDLKETHNENVTRIIESEDIFAIIVKMADTMHNAIIDDSEKQWFHENNRDPSKDTQRYVASHARLATCPTRVAYRNAHRIEEEVYE